jgi:hypothetical protein
MERARAMLLDAELDKKYWAEAARAAIYLKNRSPTKALKQVTPEEAWTGEKVDISHLRIIGCRATMHIPKQETTKLDSKSKMMIFVGYSEATKGYRLADLEKPGKIEKARYIIFLEGKQLSTERKEESGREEHLVVDLDQQMEQPDDQEDSECDHSDDN